MPSRFPSRGMVAPACPNERLGSLSDVGWALRGREGGSKEVNVTTTVWPTCTQRGVTEILQHGELGFIECEGDGSFRIVPCLWSALTDVRTGPYSSGEAALETARSHLERRRRADRG